MFWYLNVGKVLVNLPWLLRFLTLSPSETETKSEIRYKGSHVDFSLSLYTLGVMHIHFVLCGESRCGKISK